MKKPKMHEILQISKNCDKRRFLEGNQTKIKK